MCIRDRDGVALDDLCTVLVLAGDLDDDILLGIVLRNDTGDLADVYKRQRHGSMPAYQQTGR